MLAWLMNTIVHASIPYHTITFYSTVYAVALKNFPNVHSKYLAQFLAKLQSRMKNPIFMHLG